MTTIAQEYIQEGIEQGIEQGTAITYKHNLLTLLEKRFGALDGQTRDRLLALDGTTAATLFELAIDAPSLDAILDRLPNASN